MDFFFHQKTFPQGHQLNIVVLCSSPVFLIGCSLCGVSDPKKGFGVVSIPNLATNGNHTLLLRIPPELIFYTLSETNSSHLKIDGCNTTFLL